MDPITKKPYNNVTDTAICKDWYSENLHAYISQAASRTSSVQGHLWQIFRGKIDVSVDENIHITQQSASAATASGCSFPKPGLFRCSQSAMKEFKRPRFSNANEPWPPISKAQADQDYAESTCGYQNIADIANSENNKHLTFNTPVERQRELKAACDDLSGPAKKVASNKPNASAFNLMKKFQGNLQEPEYDVLLQQRRSVLKVHNSDFADHKGKLDSGFASYNQKGHVAGQPPADLHMLVLPSKEAKADSIGYQPGHISPTIYQCSPPHQNQCCMKQPAQGVLIDYDSVKSIAYVDKFALEAKAAVDKVSERATKLSGSGGNQNYRHLPHLPHCQVEASAVVLKKPFSVPRRSKPNSNRISTGCKRDSEKTDNCSNVFCRFICK